MNDPVPDDAPATEDGASPEHPMIGQVIAERYRIDGLLGKGGMGEVFRATHLSLDRPVAIKVLHPRLSDDEQVSKRFDREALASSKLDHPNIVQVIDFGTTSKGMKYFVMQYLDGQELRDRMGFSLPEAQVVDLGSQVLRALEHAHKRGLVHRDLKPENIFVVRDDEDRLVVKLVDFGIVKLLEGAGQEKLTRMGMAFGTPTYMSPEQAAGGAIDTRTDLYAVGVLLYELLTGAPPFDADEPGILLRMHILADPPPLPDTVPPGLVAVVEKLLAKEAADRYQSAREAREALEAALGGPAAETDDAMEAVAGGAVAGGAVAAAGGAMAAAASRVGAAGPDPTTDPAATGAAVVPTMADAPGVTNPAVPGVAMPVPGAPMVAPAGPVVGAPSPPVAPVAAPISAMAPTMATPATPVPAAGPEVMPVRSGGTVLSSTSMSQAAVVHPTAPPYDPLSVSNQALPRMPMPGMVPGQPGPPGQPGMAGGPMASGVYGHVPPRRPARRNNLVPIILVVVGLLVLTWVVIAYMWLDQDGDRRPETLTPAPGLYRFADSEGAAASPGAEAGDAAPAGAAAEAGAFAPDGASAADGAAADEPAIAAPEERKGKGKKKKKKGKG